MMTGVVLAKSCIMGCPSKLEFIEVHQYGVGVAGTGAVARARGRFNLSAQARHAGIAERGARAPQGVAQLPRFVERAAVEQCAERAESLRQAGAEGLAQFAKAGQFVQRTHALRGNLL